MTLTSYRDLRVWQTRMDLVEEIYRLTRLFPLDERFGLIAQMRTASVSIPSNIAEGYGRTHRGDYLRPLSISRGSLMEVETDLIIAVRLKYITKSQAVKAWRLCEKVGRQSSRLIQALDPALKRLNPKPQTQDPASIGA